MIQPTYPEIPYDEFAARTKKTATLLDEEGLDGLLIFNTQNLAYFFGLRREPGFHWFHAGLITRQGETVLVVPQIMLEFARETTWVENQNIEPWGGASHWGISDDPIDTLVKQIRALGLEDKRIGVEISGPAYIYMHVGLSEFEAIKMAFPKATFTNATSLIWKQRMIKTPWEIDILRRASKITAKSIKHAIESFEQGITETELLKIFWEKAISEGAFDPNLSGIMVFRGGAKKYGMALGRAMNAKISKGRQMFFDGGVSLKGYQVDMQRQFCIGKPPPLQKRLVEISEAGQKMAESMIKPGNQICDIHKAAMSVIGEVSDDLKDEITCFYSHTFMGHCIGLNIHEPPWISENEKTILAPGMVLSVEIPALDIPQFRVLGGFPEDIYLITPEGHEVLSKDIERKEFIV